MTREINYWALIVAALAALVVGAVWYSSFLFGNAWMELRFDPSSLDNYTQNLNALAHAGATAHTKIPLGEMLAERHPCGSRAREHPRYDRNSRCVAP